MKAKFVYKGGPGSGHHGHDGRKGKVGGSVSGKGGHNITKMFWTLDDFNKGAALTTTPSEVIPHGKVLFRLNGPKDGSFGKYSAVIELGGTMTGVGLTAEGKATTSYDKIVKLEGTADEVVNKLADAFNEKRDFIESIIKKRVDAMEQSDDFQFIDEAAQEYHDNATHKTLARIVDHADREYDLIDQLYIQRMIDKQLTFDRDGTITLYRGGDPEGLSWSTKKHEAERFARYGFGGVPIQMSGMIGIQAVLAGAERGEVTVHERKFKREDIMLPMVRYGEGEVLIRPKALGIEFDTSVLYEEDEEDSYEEPEDDYDSYSY